MLHVTIKVVILINMYINIINKLKLSLNKINTYSNMLHVTRTEFEKSLYTLL